MFMRHSLVALLLALPGVLSAQTDSVVPVNRVRAIVNDKIILQSQIEREYARMLMVEQRDAPDSATAAKEKTALLESLIDVEAWLQVAAAENVTVPLDEMDNRIDAFLSESRRELGGEVNFVKALRENGFASVDEFRRFNEDQFKRVNLPALVMQTLRRGGKIPAVPVHDSLVTPYLGQARAELGRKPATVSFRQVIVRAAPGAAARAAARAKAESLLVLVQAGVSFDSLARAESMDDSTKAVGGDLGWATRSKFVEEFTRWLFGLSPGQYSPVIETGYGYHILRVDKKEPAQVRGRHIQISPLIDSTDALKARAMADTVFTLLSSGTAFDTVLTRYNDKSANPDPYYPGYARDKLPPEYTAAIAGLQVGGVTQPFATVDGNRLDGPPAYVVALITGMEEGGEYSEEELRVIIRRRLQDAISERAYLQKAKKNMYIRVFN
jgi:peptidyl-prolyl cis-trans isomerase SurA